MDRSFYTHVSTHERGHKYAFFLALALAQIGCSDDSPSVQKTTSPVSLGTIDNGNQYPYVARITASNPDNTQTLCSAILISPGLVLTSNHCIRGGNCAIAQATEDRSESDWQIKLGAGPEPANLALSFPHTFSTVHRGATFTHAAVELLGEHVDSCTKDDPSVDLAILRLDARVPLSAVTPMHVPLNGYPRCHEELGGSFDGEIIGFGNCQPFNSAVDCPGTPNYPRTFGTVGGWGREWVRPEPPFFPCFEHTPPLPLDPPIPCTTDLPGGVYASYWQLLQPLNYNGILGGDSGGPLVSAQTFSELLPGAVAGRVGNHDGKMLCGVASRNYPVTPLDMFPNPFGYTEGNDFTAVDGLATEAWLAQHVIAADGNFIGECFAGDPAVPGVLALRDQDADNDLIPDMCDPCPNFYDADYNAGLGVTPDTDGDGVPDRCDNCVQVPNPLSIVQQPVPDGAFSRVQLDGDNDGYGDVCDSCKNSDDVVVPPFDPNDLFPVQPFTDYKCCTSDADCAPGPECPAFNPENGPPPPLPKLCFPGDSRGTIIDGLLQSNAAVEICANHCAAPVDFDCDAKGDLCDVCPKKFNPAQQDTDGDGIGDACDNCRGSDKSHPEDLNPVCDYFHPPLGDNACKAMHPDSVCLPPHPTGNGPSASDEARCTLFSDPDKDGVGQSCDNCKNKKNEAQWDGKQKNCNVVTEIVKGVPYPYVGDACDRNPCTTFTALKAIQSQDQLDKQGWVAEIDYAPRLLPPWQPGEYYGPAFQFQCVLGQHCGNPRATTGLRFCSCDELGSDGKPDPEECQNDGCVIDSGQYTMSGSNWFKPSLWPQLATINGGNGPYMSEPEIGNQMMINPVPGDMQNPASLLPETTPSTSEAYWYTKPDIAAHGGGETQLTGILWSHVTFVTELLPTPQSAALLYNPWSNYYRGGVFGPPPPPFSIVPPDLIEVAPYFFICDPLGNVLPETPDTPTLVMQSRAGFVGIRSMVGDFALGAGVSEGAAQALMQSSVKWVAASEPFASLASGLPGLASLSADGLSVNAVLGAQAGKIGLYGIDSGVQHFVRTAERSAPSSAGRMGFGAALSATEASLFVVGGQEIATGNLPGDVWRYDVPSGSWTHLALTGTRPERVLSAIYRPNDAALYVLDQARARDGERARLLRIDLSTRWATELGSWPRTAKWDRTYLSNTADNRLLLVSSSSLTNELTGVAFDPAGDLTRSSGPSFLSFQSRGSLLVQPTLTEKGLTLPIADRAGVKNFFSAIDDLMANPGSQRNLIAECL